MAAHFSHVRFTPKTGHCFVPKADFNGFGTCALLWKFFSFGSKPPGFFLDLRHNILRLPWHTRSGATGGGLSLLPRTSRGTSWRHTLRSERVGIADSTPDAGIFGTVVGSIGCDRGCVSGQWPRIAPSPPSGPQGDGDSTLRATVSVKLSCRCVSVAAARRISSSRACRRQRRPRPSY